MKYNQVYGKYSLGTGSWLSDELFELGKTSIYDERIIKSYVKQVSKDLKLISVIEKIKKLNVMDVGTGRQALALSQLGAKSINHFDISEANVNQFRDFLKKKKFL